MGSEADALHEWYDEGYEIAAELRDAMHGERDAHSLDEGRVREWQRYGREIDSRVADLGRAVRRSGLTPEEAAQRLARGEDPFR